MSKLVIVESPAKAKTISRFLDSSYDVQASFGHVRDLPNSASEVPEELKKSKWGKLGVNIEKDFEPVYIVPADKKRHVDVIKKALKGVDEVFLATDEDREGESISWHILQVAKPPKGAKIRRIVFHEITPEAIRAALAHPRDVDQNLVRAQETRRILDRLYGYTLSPLLWKKVAPKLSAGRVQSVATRLCVIRERERMAFRDAEYWDLEAQIEGPFSATLEEIDGKRLVSGKSFDPATGKQTDQCLHLNKVDARALAGPASAARPWTVAGAKSTPGTESPPKPFQTSTLQQEAARKLRFNSKRTMQVAQQLYEGIDLRGERVGLITYMRTDSLSLAERALSDAREVIQELYGKDYLPPSAVHYKTKAKGAQEAHEAIRPTDLHRNPQSVEQYLTKEQFDLYELIWKRTLACQMKAAQVMRSTLDIEVQAEGKTLTFTATGKTITFPGFLRVYVEGSDDPESELSSKERVLPNLKQGDQVTPISVEAKGHKTQPPARYTEASLIKKLEEEGIGRPSTYVSILSTIQDRGYIFKRGNELVPTFVAFAVTQLLEGHFNELVDVDFTASMEADLDEIAEGKREMVSYLKDFFLGDEGLDHQVTAQTADIPFPHVSLGDSAEGLPIVVRIGRSGPFLQRGEGGPGNTAFVPDDLPPAELSPEKVESLFAGSGASAEVAGKDPETGRNVLLKKGRFGTYLEIEQTEEEVEAKDKPRRISLPPGLSPEDVKPEDVELLAKFPRHLGEEVEVWIGRFGPFVKQGAEIRNVPDWRDAATLTLEGAKVILSQPKSGGRGAASGKPSALRELGESIKVMSGRYGPYVTDGKTNATLPKSADPMTVSLEEAQALIKEREAKGPAKKSRFGVRSKKKSR